MDYSLPLKYIIAVARNKGTLDNDNLNGFKLISSGSCCQGVGKRRERGRLKNASQFSESNERNEYNAIVNRVMVEGAFRARQAAP